jgi:PEP-CTERM motif
MSWNRIKDRSPLTREVIMRNAISKQGRSATIAAGLAVAAALTGSAHAGVIESTPTFPPIPLSFTSPTGAGCFPLGVCVTPGIFTLTSAVSTFVPVLLPAVQDIAAEATYTGSLTTPASVFLGSFTLTGTVDLEVEGRTFSTEIGSWQAELTGMSLSGPLLSFGTLSATLDMNPLKPSTGGVSIEPLGQNKTGFVVNSFFDIFMDLTLDRPGQPTLMTSVGPIRVVAVPEPSTWAMMLIGFAGLAFAARRRRAAAPAG